MGSADQKRIDYHYRDVCKAILLKDGIVIKDLTPMNILQEYRRISAKEDQIRQGRKGREQGSLSPSKEKTMDQFISEKKQE